MGADSSEAHDGTRTRDLFLTKEVLCRLSYVSTIFARCNQQACSRRSGRARTLSAARYRYGDSNPGFRRERAAS
jgi:hypothetical protein